MTTLVADASTQEVLTLNRETDARTALTRGLKEYLEPLKMRAGGGRLIQLAKVYDTWASAEDSAEYPSAAILGEGSAAYDSSAFDPATGILSTDERWVIRKLSELELDINLSIWATDSKERMEIVAMLESVLCPHDFMYGLRLALPHYHGVFVEYEPRSVEYIDSEDDAKRRFRRASISVRGVIDVLRVAPAPAVAEPTFELELASPPSQVVFLPEAPGITKVFRSVR